MSWSLHISTPQSKYKAGDTVSGSVYLISNCPRGYAFDVASIDIEFTGRSTTTKQWPRIPYSIQLFSLKSLLLTGPKRLFVENGQTEQTATNKWTFTFIIPVKCSTAPITSSSYFNSDPNQPLPNSFMDDNVQGGSCSIVYKLQATLMSPLKDGCYTKEGFTEKEIFIHRPRSVEWPISNINTKSVAFTHRSLLLLPREERGSAHRPLTIKEKLRLKPPSTEHLPRAVFTIRVQTPSAAVISQPLPLMLQIGYDVGASTVPPPVFHLTRLSIHLCEETTIRGLKREGEPDTARWTKEIMLQEKVFETQRPRLEEHVDLRNVMDTSVDHDLTPTFKTFNIARTYSLKVFVRVECVGKEHFVFGDYKPCTLLADEYNESAAIMYEEENDPPPPYDLVTRQAVPEYEAHHTEPHGISHTGHNAATIPDAVLSTVAVPEPRARASSAAGI